MNRLALFDIDGTLVEGWRVHKKGFGVAIKEIAGIDASLSDIDYFGKVDKEAIFEVLKKHGIRKDKAIAMTGPVIKALIRYYRAEHRKERVRVLPGVKELLKELKRRDVALALTTGNAREIAYLKLSLAGLDQMFPVGGFGDEAMNRWECAEIAIRRAKEHYRKDFDRSRIFMIGDTKIDVKTGKKDRIRSIGVATGGTSIDELKSMRPDYLFRDMSDYKQVLRAIMR